MTKNQIFTALESMGFSIMRAGAISLGITHPNCCGLEIVPLTTKGLGMAHNWLCQQEAPPEAIEHSRSALIQAMQEAQG